MTETHEIPREPAHERDILLPGATVPTGTGEARVTARQVYDVAEANERVDRFPVPDWAPIDRDAVLTIEHDDGRQEEVGAFSFVSSLDYRYDGQPSVRADVIAGVGAPGSIGVQTPETGSNTLTRQQARDLAEHLREHAGLEPLYALLGEVDSSERMHTLADALDHAADVRDLSDAIDAADEATRE